MWLRSVKKNNLRYTTILSDGDAKTYNHLCERAPYGPKVPIVKKECVNHVQKRLRTGLRNLTKSTV